LNIEQRQFLLLVPTGWRPKGHDFHERFDRVNLSNIVDFVNPEMVVLGGGFIDAMPEIVREEVQEGILTHSTEAAREGVKVIVAKLKEHAVTTGAAKLMIDLSA
jgi:hypothetical protein